jgi:hypothetical protein
MELEETIMVAHGFKHVAQLELGLATNPLVHQSTHPTILEVGQYLSNWPC